MTALADKFTKVGSPGTATTLSAPGYTDGVSTSINVGSTTNWPTDKVYFAIDQAEIVQGVEQRVVGTYCEFSGKVSSAGVIGNLNLEEGTGQDYPAGSLTRVYIPVSSSRENAMVDGLILEHNVDGTHDEATITSRTEDTTPEPAADYLLVYDNSATALKKVKPSNLGVGTGWVQTNETWTYSSYDSTNKTGVITVPTDATTKYSVGMRVRFTNNSATQYGIITKITATAMTVYFGTDYSLTNAAITVPYYSSHKAPFGFPIDPAKWTVTTSNTNDCLKTSPVSGTWYGDTGLSSTGANISLPIGAWRVEWSATISSRLESAGICSVFGSLSTSASSESDNTFTVEQQINAISTPARNDVTLGRLGNINVSAATTYYLIAKTATAGLNSMGFRNSTASIPAIIKAVCSYL